MRIKAERIKALALQNGFDACGISSIDVIDNVKEYVTNWITSGYRAEMHWYEDKSRNQI